MKSKYDNILKAYEKVLGMAEAKLQNAIDKNKEWNIEHYKTDVQTIKNEIEFTNNLKKNELEIKKNAKKKLN
jgi:hypothetical protein